MEICPVEICSGQTDAGPPADLQAISIVDHWRVTGCPLTIALIGLSQANVTGSDPSMHIVSVNDVQSWLGKSENLSDCLQSIGQRQIDDEYLDETLRLPLHLQFVIRQMADEAEGEPVSARALDSISFYSLCRGLFLPLSGLSSSKVAQLFGLKAPEPPDAAQREALVERFFAKECGLGIVEKVGCVLGDPTLGKKSGLQRDSLLRLLLSVQMRTRNELLDRLTQVGDVANLYAESRPTQQVANPLTAAEVLRTLKSLSQVGQTKKFQLLRSLLARCGKLEAYVLAKLLLRKAGFGFDYQGPILARVIAQKFRVPEDQVAHAMALTDLFNTVHVLETEGADGLRKIQLRPLSPVRPTLASGTTDDIDRFPVWVERKYDGIRLMLHKSTDAGGSVLCGAYTRNRGDWLELVPGLDRTIRMLPARSVILDGELYGTVLDMDRVRPATVYEVYAALQGQPTIPVNLKFAAFDILFLEERDLTGFPLSQRRQWLTQLLMPLTQMPLPVPLSISEGQLAQTKDDVNRLFHHFRAQGYEGIITKDLDGTYLIATRDPKWRKRKPEITLDLVLLGATLAVTSKENAGLFGSYVIAARTSDGGWKIVGDVAGLDRVRDAQIQAEIQREGLMTGKRIERPSASGARPGVELRPAIVVTVKFEGIARDQTTKELSLRDPKIAMIRSDKSAFEADTVEMLQEVELRQRMG